MQGSTNLSLKDQIVNSLSFVGHRVSTVITQLYYYNMTAATDNMQRKECDCVPTTATKIPFMKIDCRPVWSTDFRLLTHGLMNIWPCLF